MKRNSPSVKIPRILLIGPSLTGGGAENHFRNLCRQLSAFHFDICLLKAGERNHEIFPGVTIFDLKWRNEFSYVRIIAEIRKLLKQGTYNVLFSFGSFPNFIAWAASRFCPNRPKIIMCEITRPWSAMQGLNFIRKVIYFILYKVSYRTADFVVANSLSGMEECVKYFGVDKQKTSRVPNLIDEAEIIEKASLTPTLVELASGKKIIATASRLVDMKRLDTLIEAAVRLDCRNDWSIYVVGDGPARDTLVNMVRSYNIMERVIFWGWLDNPWPIIRQSVVFVSCSALEGFSNSVLEAMFLGIPVITSFCSTDAREMCRKGAALGFEIGDEETLAKHLLAVLSSSELREKMRKNAFFYSRTHETSVGIKYYEDAIRQTLSVQR